MKPSIRVTLMTAVFLVLAAAPPVRAQEKYPFFRDTREQGMGGAAVAVVDDETALFLNPAGLGKVRGSSLALVNPQIETNYDTQSAATVNGNYTSIGSPQPLLTMAKANPGKNMHAMFELMPTYATTNFALGAYAKYSIDGLFDSTTDKMQFNYTNDDGAAIGYCFRLFEGRLKIGVSGKIINRVYANESVAGSSTNLALGSLVSEGTGVGWDGGVILTAPWTFLPTIAATAHDIGNTKFNLGSGIFYKPGTTPPPQYQSVDVGVALFPIFNNGVRSSITADYRDVQNLDPAAWYRNFHAGAEIDVNDTFFIRGGMNEIYYTAGLEFDFGHNQFQLATYGEDIGTDASPQEDRRYMFMYGLRF